MSAPVWSPEPWRVREDEETAWVEDAKEMVVLDPPSAPTAPTARARADLHRAAACVSACAGVPTEALAALGAGGLARLAQLAAMRRATEHAVAGPRTADFAARLAAEFDALLARLGAPA